MFKEEKEYLYIEEFLKYGVKTAFTKKVAGNMALYIENCDENKVIENRNKILRKLKLENKKIVFAKQTHSTNILNIEDDFDFNTKLENIDGFATKREDVVILTFYADCLPIYLYDKKNKVISLVHSGWVGTYNNMIGFAINNLIDNYNSDIKDIIIGLGIGISQKNYEVQEDFYNKFVEKFSKDILEDVFKIENGKYFFDNIKINENLALKYGIISNNIIKQDKDVLEVEANSYRRDGKNSERSMALISK